jgi:hypothetical protein
MGHVGDAPMATCGDDIVGMKPHVVGYKRQAEAERLVREFENMRMEARVKGKWKGARQDCSRAI